MKVLVTGAGGQVGREVVEAFSADEVCAADHAALDVTDRSAVLAAVTSTHPDVIVHCASWTADIRAGDLGRQKYDGRPQPPIL